MNLSETEKKILLLAMDREAASGEVQSAAIKLIELLRKRYTSGHDLVKDLEQLPRQTVQYRSVRYVDNPYATYRMPFGKHKGRMLKEIPADYLLWVLTNVRSMNSSTRTVIQRWMAQL